MKLRIAEIILVLLIISTAFEPKHQQPTTVLHGNASTERYFLVGYDVRHQDLTQEIGSVCMHNSEMISAEFARKEIKQYYQWDSTDRIIIISLHEFANEAEYNTFEQGFDSE